MPCITLILLHLHTPTPQESDDRLVKAAYEFNLQFAAGFQASASGGPSGSTAAGGSSSVQAAGEGSGGGGGEGGDEGGDGGLVDDEWRRVPGGPFTAKLMTKSRQPVSTAAYRNYGVAVPIEPIDCPLYPGCQIKFPVVAGGPPEGIICPLPRSWGADTHVLIFKLKLSKAAATEDTVTIASALYREPHVDTDECEAVEVDLMAPLHPSSPVHPAEAEDAEAEEAAATAAAATAAAAKEAAQAAAAAAEAMYTDEEEEAEAAAAAAEAMDADDDEEDEALEGGEEAAVAVVLTDEEIAARLEELHCVWHDESEEQLDGTAETDLDGVVELLKALGAEACVLVVPGTTYEIQRSIYGERAFTISSESNEVDDEEEMGEDADAPPPPPPPPPPPVAPRSSSRPSKRKQLFGDNGEFDGPASRFRSAPSSRKASVDPSVEMGVPAYALPGEQVWAMGLRAGVRMRFKAEVVKLRNQFPRIVVKYIATEEDETSRHVLPDVLTAYLHMGDLKERDW